jgi:hypothetical protein
MDLKTLSTDSLRNICAFLMEENLVTEEQFLQILSKRPSNDLKRTVDYIHTCLCQDDHELDCQYYVEEQRTDCWISPAHVRWLEEVARMMQHFSIHSETSLRDHFKAAMAAFKVICELPPSTKKVFKLVERTLAM